MSVCLSVCLSFQKPIDIITSNSCSADDRDVLNCAGECEHYDDNETWLCTDQCQSWFTPCKGKCPPGLELNCANICDTYDNITSYLCSNECVTAETPCQGTCPNWQKVLCNGKCQDRTLQCDGECLDERYKFANCDGTCSYYQESWLCNSVCQSSEEPCNKTCPEGKFKI
jgi:hypothetical protein